MVALTPQTEDGISFANCAFEYQIDGDVSATDASGFFTAVEQSGYERQIGQAFTGNGDKAILTPGKTDPADITVSIIYTDGDAEPFRKLAEAKETKKKVKFIWYPGGSKEAGQTKYETDYGYLTSVTYPAGEVSSADPVLCQAVLKTPKITPTTIAA